MEKSVRARRPPTSLDRFVARRIAGRLRDLSVVTRLWDGATVASGPETSQATITFLGRRALLATLLQPNLGMAEGYVAGSLEFSGDLVAVLEAANRAAAPEGRLSRSGRSRLIHPRISADAARRNARGHYDLGNDFFALWLDPTLTYTCAYFADEQGTLESAQRAKMDYVCRKLALVGGERVVEAGCGWGELALFMAERYGARVRAFNVSTAQTEYARDQAKRRGLASRVEFIEEDYRAIAGSYDVFVSVGMLETVGLRCYGELGRIIKRCLVADGRGLLHSIGRSQPVATDRWIARHIFPGSYYPSLREMSRIFEPNGLVVVDVENLRLHYVQTLEHWLARYEAAAPVVAEMFSASFARMWRLYLASALAAFKTGWLQLYQVAFTHTDNTAAAAPSGARRGLANFPNDFAGGSKP